MVAVEDLNWLVGQAVPADQERFSHLDAVDIAATTSGARTAFAAIAPLGDQIDPVLTERISGRVTTLSNEVAGLGPPGQVNDVALPAPRLLALAQQADATAAGLAQLSAEMAVLRDRRRWDVVSRGLSRRQLLAGSGLATAGVLAAAAGTTVGSFLDPAGPAGADVAGASTVPFFGAHQAGITTPEQARLVFATYDVTAADADRIGGARWPPGAVPPPDSPPA